MYNTKSPLTSMRRISDGTNTSRFTLPPISTSSHTPTSLSPLLHGDNNRMYPSSSSAFVETKKEYQPTFSYSYPDTAVQPHTTTREEYYFPVYNKHEWSEDESLMPIIENSKAKKKKEMDDRIQEIDREFLENREVLYGEKIKQLQDELVDVETGHHETFDSSIADLEQKRRETIHNARLMMIYQISTVDEQYNLNSKKVHDESLAEQKEIQNALFSIIEEKRKKLKEDKDGEGDLFMGSNNNQQQHQTRNRKRLLRKRGELEALGSLTTTAPNHHHSSHYKRKQDRLKENPSHLIGVLTHRVEEDIEADFYEMTRKR